MKTNSKHLLMATALCAFVASVAAHSQNATDPATSKQAEPTPIATRGSSSHPERYIDILRPGQRVRLYNSWRLPQGGLRIQLITEDQETNLTSDDKQLREKASQEAGVAITTGRITVVGADYICVDSKTANGVTYYPADQIRSISQLDYDHGKQDPE